MTLVSNQLTRAVEVRCQYFLERIVGAGLGLIEPCDRTLHKVVVFNIWLPVELRVKQLTTDDFTFYENSPFRNHPTQPG